MTLVTFCLISRGKKKNTTDLCYMIVAEIQADQGGVAWTSQHGVAQGSHGIEGQV